MPEPIGYVKYNIWTYNQTLPEPWNGSRTRTYALRDARTQPRSRRRSRRPRGPDYRALGPLERRDLPVPRARRRVRPQRGLRSAPVAEHGALAQLAVRHRDDRRA